MKIKLENALSESDELRQVLIYREKKEMKE